MNTSELAGTPNEESGDPDQEGSQLGHIRGVVGAPQESRSSTGDRLPELSQWEKLQQEALDEFEFLTRGGSDYSGREAFRDIMRQAGRWIPRID